MPIRPTSIIYFISTFLVGCTTFSPMDQTGQTVNRDATDYANDAVLLNLARSKLFEPLTFITITGLDGTSSATGSIGLPSVVFGPALLKNYTFGSNSVGRTNSNTFHASVVDDRESFAALLAPINPALIASFIQQGYPRELIFFLVTSRIRQVNYDCDGSDQAKNLNCYGTVTGVAKEWLNEPDVQGKFQDFQSIMTSLLLEGLTAETDVTTLPAFGSLPPNKLCIDSIIEPPYYAKETFIPAGSRSDTCEHASWIQAKNAGGQSSTPGAADSSGNDNPATIAVGPDHSLWMVQSDKGKITRIAPNATGDLTSKTFSYAPNAKKTARAEFGPLTAFPLNALLTDRATGIKSTLHFQLSFRSTYGVYAYIGAIMRTHDFANLLPPDASNYGGIAHINVSNYSGADGTSACFSNVTYRRAYYCVPEEANGTKRLFSLLQQLQQLNTAPSNAPTTLTVTPVP